MSPRRKWDSPTPFPQASVPSPPEPKGGGTHWPAGEGWGNPNSGEVTDTVVLFGWLGVWGHRRGGGFRQINPCRKALLQVKFFRSRHLVLHSISLIFLRARVSANIFSRRALLSTLTFLPYKTHKSRANVPSPEDEI